MTAWINGSIIVTNLLSRLNIGILDNPKGSEDLVQQFLTVPLEDYQH